MFMYKPYSQQRAVFKERKYQSEVPQRFLQQARTKIAVPTSTKLDQFSPWLVKLHLMWV